MDKVEKTPRGIGHIITSFIVTALIVVMGILFLPLALIFIVFIGAIHVLAWVLYEIFIPEEII